MEHLFAFLFLGSLLLLFVILVINPEEKLYSEKISSIRRIKETNDNKDDDNSHSNFDLKDYIKIIGSDKKIIDAIVECIDIGSSCYKEEYVCNVEHEHSENIFLTEVIIAVTSISFLSFVMQEKNKSIEKYAKSLAIGLANSLVDYFFVSMPNDLFIEYMDFRFDLYKEKLYSTPNKQSAIPKALDTIVDLYSGDIGLLLFCQNKTNEFFITKEYWEKVPALRFKTKDEGYQETIKSLTQKCLFIEERLHQIMYNDNVIKTLEKTNKDLLYNERWHSLIDEISKLVRDTYPEISLGSGKLSYIELTFIIEIYFLIVAGIYIQSNLCKKAEYLHEFILCAVNNLFVYLMKNSDNIEFENTNISQRFKTYFCSPKNIEDLLFSRFVIYTEIIRDLGVIKTYIEDDTVKQLTSLAKITELHCQIISYIYADLTLITQNDLYEIPKNKVDATKKLSANSTKITNLIFKYAKILSAKKG